MAIHRGLLDWAQDYPVLTKSRNGQAILWTSLLTAYTFDGVVDQTAHEFAAQSLALFMYDEVVDDPSGNGAMAAIDVMAAIRDACVGRPSSSVNDEFEIERQVVTAFADAMSNPVRRSQSARWTKDFHGIVEMTVKGHLLSEEWRKRENFTPSLAEHLENGSYTAGAPIVAFSAAMSTAPDGLSDAHHDDYLAACLDLGWCVRAANDIAGLADDIRSGQTNAVSLGVKESRSSEVWVARSMLRDVHARLDSMLAIADDMSHPLALQYRWLANCTEFHVDWYVTKSGYSFSVEDWLAFEKSGPFSEAMLQVLVNT